MWVSKYLKEIGLTVSQRYFLKHSFIISELTQWRQAQRQVLKDDLVCLYLVYPILLNIWQMIFKLKNV